MIRGKVSIVIPNYNKADFLDACIQSCLEQTYPDIEIVVVDDHSTDRSQKILERYVDCEKIRVVFLKRNSGVSNARNVGAKVAKGIWLTFLDSDDILIDPRKIENEVTIVHSYRDIAFSQWIPLSEDGMARPFPFEHRNIYSRRSAISKVLSVSEPSYRQLRGYLFSKQLFEEVGGYDFKFNLFEDFYLQCKLILRGRLKYTRRYGEGYRNIAGPRLSVQGPAKTEEALMAARELIYRDMNCYQRLFYRWRMSRLFHFFQRITEKLSKPEKHPDVVQPLFVSDFHIDAHNSVASILEKLLAFHRDSAVVILSDLPRYCYLEERCGVKHYCFSNKKLSDKRCLFRNASLNNSLLALCAKALNRIGMERLSIGVSARVRANAVRRLLKISKCNYVVSLRFSPDLDLVKLRKPFSVALYDTVLDRPNAGERLLRIEKKVIAEADNYFVPSYFSAPYRKVFPSCECLRSFDLPLFPTMTDVNRARLSSAIGHLSFAYFGQLQPFRHPTESFAFLNSAGIDVDVFSTDSPPNLPNIRYHEPFPQSESLNYAAATKFPIVLDNDSPYENYLPSKCYQLVALCKPIIILGVNKTSALKAFFNGYPRVIYLDYRESDSTTKLHEFISTYSGAAFDDDLYEKFRRKYDSATVIKKIYNALCLSIVRGK